MSTMILLLKSIMEILVHCIRDQFYMTWKNKINR